MIVLNNKKSKKQQERKINAEVILSELEKSIAFVNRYKSGELKAKTLDQLLKEL